MLSIDRTIHPLAVSFFQAGEGEGGSGSSGTGGGGAGEGQGGEGGGKGAGGDDDEAKKRAAAQLHDRTFNKGYKLGAEKAETEAQTKQNQLLQALGIDTDQDVEAQLTGTKELLKAAREGKAGKGDEDKMAEVLKGVQVELKSANKTIEEMKTTHASELEHILINQTLMNLAGGAGLAKSVQPAKVVLWFKDDFKLGLDGERAVTVNQQNGAPIIDSQTGEPKTLNAVFQDWIGGQTALLAGAGTGGSGGLPPGGDGGAGGGQPPAGREGKYTPEQVAKMSMPEYEQARKDKKI